MMEDWNYLRSVKVRPADVLREATESALRKKALEMKMETSSDNIPF